MIVFLNLDTKTEEMKKIPLATHSVPSGI